MPKHRHTYKPLLGPTAAAQVAAGTAPYKAAWDTFYAGHVKAALKVVPSVYAGGNVTPIVDYVQLDTDGHLARTLAIAWAVKGDAAALFTASTFLIAWATGYAPVPFKETGDYVGDQGGYHQSYGLFSFALAYDLVRGSLPPGERLFLEKWLRSAADALKTYLDHWAANHVPASGTITYDWSTADGKVLTESARDWNVGRDTVICPLTAWLACAVAGRYVHHIDLLFSPDYPLNVPAVLRASCAPDNQGDGRGTVPAPQAQVVAGLSGPHSGSGAGGLVYMTYNARMASILLAMSRQLGRSTPLMEAQVRSTWDWLAQFYSPKLAPTLATGDKEPWGDMLARMWLAHSLFPGDPVVTAAVNGGQASVTGLYDGQYLGPVVLV